MYAEGLPAEVRLKAVTTDGRLPFVFEASGSVLHYPACSGELAVNQDPGPLLSGQPLLVGHSIFPQATMASHYRGTPRQHGVRHIAGCEA